MANSHLVEPGIKYFLRESLKNCKKYKDYYHNLYFNIFAMGIFVLFFGGLLYYMYKGKLTPIEKNIKKQKQEKYINDKIKNIQRMRDVKKHQKNLITNLPQNFDSLNV